jgi:hypothetical protein
MVEIYGHRCRPGSACRGIVAVASHNVAHVDINDERSLPPRSATPSPRRNQCRGQVADDSTVRSSA